MNIPFTVKQFLDVFGSYNTAVSPIQILFILLALSTIFLAVKKRNYSDKVISGILSFFWLWIGVVYHLIFFTGINPAAYAFGAINIIQAILFFAYGIVRKDLTFGFKNNVAGIAGIVFIVYALIVYPLLGIQFGHIYPRTPTFGLPCPTTIFTFGILLWTKKKVSPVIIGIPLLWSLIGFTAALNLGIYQDFGLLAAGLLGSALIILNNYKLST